MANEFPVASTSLISVKQILTSGTITSFGTALVVSNGSGAVNLIKLNAPTPCDFTISTGGNVQFRPAVAGDHLVSQLVIGLESSI